MFIAHDLAVVKHISDRIAVMYLGKIIEYADADTLYDHPVHPYTLAFISAIPVPDPLVKKKRKIIGGDVPSPVRPRRVVFFIPAVPMSKISARA